MILASHGIVASQIASFDADAVAFFGRVTTAGGSLSLTERQAVNQLVLDLKANSLWTPMKAIYPMVGASAAACAQNLKSSSFTGTFSSGWTFASTGVTPNGTSAYFDTNFNVSSNFTANNLSVSGYSRTNTQDGNDRFLFGVQTPNGVWWDNYNNTQRNIGSGSLSITLSGQSGFDGFMLVNTQNSTSTKVIRNLTTLNTTTTLNTGIIPSRNMVFSVLDYGSKAFYDNKQLAFGHLGDGLTDTQASDFYTAVQAFQTTLSRQV